MSVRILTGDCRAMLATLPDASVQCCVTSPPYFGLRDYGHAGQIGLEQTPDAYVAEMVAVFRDVRRVLRDDGVLWLNLGDSYAGNSSGGFRPGAGRADGVVDDRNQRNRNGNPCPPGAKPKDLLMIPARVALALQADGWWLRSEVTWCKGNAMPESVVDRPSSATEKVFLLTKSSRYFYDNMAIAEPAVSDHPSGNGFKRDARETYKDANGARGNDQQWTGVGGTRNARNWWVINSAPFSGAHFATMPPELAERCVKAGTSERGGCPTCGAPWARQTSRGAEAPAVAPSEIDRFGTGNAGVHRKVGGQYQKWLDANPMQTTGWSPTCACPAHTPVQQTVLDPFGGAGTTALVADRLGRNAILIELNPEYAALARERLTDDCPMFASVA